MPVGLQYTARYDFVIVFVVWHGGLLSLAVLYSTRLRLYTSLTLSVLLYGSETWTLYARQTVTNFNPST